MKSVRNGGKGRGEVLDGVCFGAGSDASFADVVEVGEELVEFTL